MRPPPLVEMIMANRWDAEAKQMTVDTTDEYFIMSGEKYMTFSSATSQLELSEAASADSGVLGNRFKFLLAPDGLMVCKDNRALLAQ